MLLSRCCGAAERAAVRAGVGFDVEPSRAGFSGSVRVFDVGRRHPACYLLTKSIRGHPISIFQSLDGERVYFRNKTEQRRQFLELRDAGLSPGTVQVRVVANPESFFRLRKMAYRLTLDEAKKAKDWLAAVVDRLEAKSV